MSGNAAIEVDRKVNQDGYIQLAGTSHYIGTQHVGRVALGYKQLLEVERGWRDMKTTLDLRPVYHRHEDRIRAHILLCWLGLLLIRVAETGTGHTWTKIRTEIDRLHIGVFTGPPAPSASAPNCPTPEDTARQAEDHRTAPRPRRDTRNRLTSTNTTA